MFFFFFFAASTPRWHLHKKVKSRRYRSINLRGQVLRNRRTAGRSKTAILSRTRVASVASRASNRARRARACGSRGVCDFYEGGRNEGKRENVAAVARTQAVHGRPVNQRGGASSGKRRSAAVAHCSLSLAVRESAGVSLFIGRPGGAEQREPEEAGRVVRRSSRLGSARLGGPDPCPPHAGRVVNASRARSIWMRLSGSLSRLLSRPQTMRSRVGRGAPVESKRSARQGMLGHSRRRRRPRSGPASVGREREGRRCASAT